MFRFENAITPERSERIGIGTAPENVPAVAGLASVPEKPLKKTPAAG